MRLRTVLAGVLAGIAAVGLTASPVLAASTTIVTYSATQTIPVPPASSFQGSAGGDGWSLAFSTTQVFNVFHHQNTLTVACHNQSDASSCWDPRTLTDNGVQFASSGHPGLWLDDATGKLYIYATRTSDGTGGVVCADTTIAASEPNPFCGFTPLTAVGHAPILDGISAISEPVRIGSDLYAVNYVNGPSAPDENALMCFDTSTKAACAGQPYALDFGASPPSAGSYPEPGVAAIGGRVIATLPGLITCWDRSTGGTCSGSWPVSEGGATGGGAPFPLLDAGGTATGFCLPVSNTPCLDFTGASVATPAGLSAAITPSSGWNGGAVVIGPRVYVPNGNANAVGCYDYSTGATCPNFPSARPDLYLLYSVVSDPNRPSCLWVNADGGSAQIQNFDAYTGGACGQGPIRVLAASFIVPTQLCQPATYSSLQVLDPAPGSYTDGAISFQDGGGNAIPGLSDRPLDATGIADLSALDLSTASGLPQFLIALNGISGEPGSVKVQLTWTGTDDPSCVLPGTVVGTPPVVTPPVVTPPVIPTVVQTDIAPVATAGPAWLGAGVVGVAALVLCSILALTGRGERETG